MHTGSCFCKSVTYKITSDLRNASHCHCTICQQTHGAAFASYAEIPPDALTFSSGEDLLTKFYSSATGYRIFCSKCGSNLIWARNDTDSTIDVALASLDNPPKSAITRHIYTDTKASWLDLNEHITDDN